MGNLFRKNLQIKGIINSIHLDHKSKKTFFRQEIPESISTKKETLDIDIFIISRNGDKKIMRSIRITSRPPSKIRKSNCSSASSDEYLSK